LPGLPVEAVVHQAVGQVEVEVALQGVADLPKALAILQEAVEDRLADPVVVVGLRVDALQLGAEGATAAAGGPVLGGGAMDEEDGPVGERADAALVEGLAATESAAVRAGGLLGGMTALGMHDLGWRVRGGRRVRQAYNGHGVNSWQDGLVNFRHSSCSPPRCPDLARTDLNPLAKKA
jgi:hypothetical protein